MILRPLNFLEQHDKIILVRLKIEPFPSTTSRKLPTFLDLIWKSSLPTEKAVRKFKNYKENLLEVSVEQAEKVGYEPCKICIGE